MNVLEISTIGYNYSHGADFVIDRPNGLGYWLVLLIKTPAVFFIDGKNYNIKEDSFILLSPTISYRYRGTDDVYTDDWIHFNADENDLKMFEKLGIPINEPVCLGDIEELSELIHILSYEHYSCMEYSSEVEKRYFEIFFLKLGRILSSGTSISSRLFTEKNHRMTQLRTEIVTQPSRNMSVDDMASAMNMSRSGFQHLYKKMFGVSVIQDITRSRMERAKRLLSSTNLTVEEISRKCGYSNEYCFMRKFKEQCGKTPTEYRRTF